MESSSARPPGRPRRARTTSGYVRVPVFIEALQVVEQGIGLCPTHQVWLGPGHKACGSPDHSLY